MENPYIFVMKYICGASIIEIGPKKAEMVFSSDLGGEAA